MRTYFTDDEAVFLMPRGTGERPNRASLHRSGTVVSDVVRMGFAGAKPRAGARGEGPLPGRSHYLLGRVPSKWIRDVPHYGGFRTPEVWPGIAVRWKGTADGALEYDFLVAPGADPDRIALTFGSARAPSLDGEGDLLVRTEGGVLRHRRPIAWQGSGAERTPVDVRFVLRGGGRVGIETGRYDRSWTLVVDPVVEYSSYLGGSGSDFVRGVGAGPDGSAILAGDSSSTDFPVSASAHRTTFAGGSHDVFVTRTTADGTGVAYSTYLGGTGEDRCLALAVDSDGAAYVTGYTATTDFPTVGAYQDTKLSSGISAYVTKVDPFGESLDYSTYLCGSEPGMGYGIAVDASGSPCVVGYSASTDFPVASALQEDNAGGTDAVVTKFAPDGASLVWSTYLGGATTDSATAVALDANGNVYLTGTTGSSDFPVASAYQGALKGTQDAFVAKIAADGQSKPFATYLGGQGADTGAAIGVNSVGTVWVAGTTNSSDFPLASPVQSVKGSGDDAFVTALSSSGNALVASTYLGGAGLDDAQGIAVGAKGVVYVACLAGSAGLPAPGGLQTAFSGDFDGYLCAFNSDGASIRWATYYGGNLTDSAIAVATNGPGAVLAAGICYSTNLPTLAPFQAVHAGSSDSFILSLCTSPKPPTACEATLTGLSQVEVTWLDKSQDEAGFTLERSVDGGPFVERKTLPADATTTTESGLVPSTNYAYRVKAFSDEGVSDPTNADDVTTPASPVAAPFAPSNLQAVVVSPRRVDLSWNDNSADEEYFQVARAEGTGLYATLATPHLGITTYSDATPQPERIYSFKVRAQNSFGGSIFTNVVTVTMPGTLDVALVSGKVVDSATFGRDSVKASGTMGFGPDALVTGFDPMASTVALRFGDYSRPPLLQIPAAGEGWILKRGKWTWKSPRGFLPKSKIVVDPALGTWQAIVKKLEFPTPPANPLRVTLTVGSDAAHHESDWTPGRKAGQFKFP